MKRWIILLMLAGALIGIARADEAFDRANADYDAGRFRAAAEGYEQLLEKDGPRVSVLQNLGSTYHRLGEDGKAILAFKRALLLDPGDPSLKANLKLVSDRAAVFSTEAGGFWDRWTGSLSRREWSVLVLAGMAIVLAALVSWAFSRSKRHRLKRYAIALAGLALAKFSLRMVDAASDTETRGIVVSHDATLRISPFDTADGRGRIQEGREVRLGQEKDGWTWVTVEGGAAAGWLRDGEVEPLVPRQQRSGT